MQKIRAMGLTSGQKHYIRKNAKHHSLETISGDLGLDQKIVKKYLKKIWRQDKYAKYINGDSVIGKNNNLSHNFNFWLFFQENLNIFILLFVLVFVSYFNSLDNDFVSDDIPSILKNVNIGNLGSAFNGFVIGWPRNILNFLIFKLTGTSTFLFRSVNVLFHLGSTFLVFILLSIISKKRIALLASIIFAVHPILIESIAWISGGTYPQYSFFLLFSLFGYIAFRENKKYIAVLLFFMAILSSEKAFVFPLILLTFEASFGTLKNNWKKTAPYLLVGLFTIIFLLVKLTPKITGIEAMTYVNFAKKGNCDFFLQIPVAIGTYLKLIFWPEKLSLYQTEMNFSVLQYSIFILVFGIFSALILYSWKRNRPIFFWLTFFVIALLPTLTPFKISWIVAERYVYLGSLGIFVIVAMFFDWLIEKSREKNENYKYAIYSVFAIIIISLSVRTIIRNMDWQNEDTLWIATAKNSPSGQSIHNNLGDVYARNGDLEKAAEEFRKAIEINPHYADAHHNLGNTYKSMRKNDLAIESYQKALEINPNIWQSYQNLAVIYYEMGDMKKAEENLKQAIKINPTDTELQKSLSFIQFGTKK